MSDCKVYRREIVEAADGDALGRGARAHADACRACAEELRGGESLRALVRGLGKVEAPADFEFRLRARMAAAEGKGRRGPFGGLRLVYRFAPVAVAVAFLFVAASLYFRQPAQSRPDNGPAQAAGDVASNATAARTEAPPPARVVEARNSTPAPVAPARVAVADRAGAGKPQLSRAATPGTHSTARRLTEAARGTGGAGVAAALNTAVMSVGSAEVIRGRTLSIPVEKGAAPLRLLLRDERGALRLVPVRPVSFGAQDLIARDGARRQATPVEDEGVW